MTQFTSGITECKRQLTRKSLARALEEDRIVVSADTDFGVILAAQAANRPSFILFRNPNLLGAHDFLNILLPALPALEPELMNGCVAVFRYSRLRDFRFQEIRFIQWRIERRESQSQSVSQ